MDPDATREPPGPMPVGELRQEGALQVRDLLVPEPPLATSAVDWRELFDAPDRRTLLDRLVEGDPLSLRARVLRTCREGWLLLHADRVLLRALALCAYHGQFYDGDPDPTAWCDAIAVQATRDLISEDLEQELVGESIAEADRVLYRMFVELFGIEPALSRLASVRYHQAPPTARRVVWRIAVEGRSLAEVAALEGRSGDEVEGDLRRTLRALSDRRPVQWKDVAAALEDDA